jgi:hypothetical protein
MKKLVLLSIFISALFSQDVSYYKKLKIEEDKFEGTKKEIATFKTPFDISGTWHYYQIFRFTSKKDPELQELYLQIKYQSDDWLFMESASFKNLDSGWSKDLKWDYYDGSRETKYGGEVEERILIPLSVEDAIELLSQKKFTSRIYGKDYYSEKKVTQTKSVLAMLKLLD